MNAHVGRSGGGTLSIENGYFVFTLMPSLRCPLDCPHCYLNREQRRDGQVMALDDLEAACRKVDAYYRSRGLLHKTVICYWYGGEPTGLGMDYFEEAVARIGRVLARDAGYVTKHAVLTSLVTVDEGWIEVFRRLTGGRAQTSFDGPMRGKGYLKRWESRVREAVAADLAVSTVTVVNRTLLDWGPERSLDYLSGLGVRETSWLPFMWNERNDGANYDTFAPTMGEYAGFMIGLTNHWLSRKQQCLSTPEIGQMRFILGQRNLPALSNVAGQTLFLLPDGTVALPDYRHGWQEFMRPFGNLLVGDFGDILHGAERRRYLRKQTLRNGNPKCFACPHGGHCLMEFWKTNRPGDECFGARAYVEWVLKHAEVSGAAGGTRDLKLY